MRNVAETVGTALLMIVLVGTLPAIGIFGLWWLVAPLTLALMIGVPLSVLWPLVKPSQRYRSDHPEPFALEDDPTTRRRCQRLSPTSRPPSSCASGACRRAASAGP